MIPEEFSYKIIRDIHDYLGHPGASTLAKTIENVLNIPKVRKICENVRKKCAKCQQFVIGKANFGKLSGFLRTNYPFKDISSDILGPIPTMSFPGKHEHNKFWIVTIIDRCTRVCQLQVVYNLKPLTIISATKKWIAKFGSPQSFLSDQGRQYISQEFTNFLKESGIESILCSAYSPTVAVFSLYP